MSTLAFAIVCAVGVAGLVSTLLLMAMLIAGSRADLASALEARRARSR